MNGSGELLLAAITGEISPYRKLRSRADPFRGYLVNRPGYASGSRLPLLTSHARTQ